MASSNPLLPGQRDPVRTDFLRWTGKKVSLHRGSAIAAPGAPHLSRPWQLAPAVFGQLSRVCLRHPPAASCLSATCRWPAACPIILPPLPLRHNAEVEPAGSGPAAYRPSSVPHGRPHGGGGGAGASSVRSALPSPAGHTAEDGVKTTILRQLAEGNRISSRRR